MALTEMGCRNAKQKEKPYKLFDTGGLFLLVTMKGARLWRLKYRFLGKEKLMALGAYPLISLAEAREARNKAKKLLAQHPPIDPMGHREEQYRLAIRNAENTFEAVAREWHEMQKARWSEKHAQSVLHRLEIDVFPYVGTRPISAITPPELLENCLRKIEKRGALDIAGRVKQVCGAIFRYGIQTGRCERDAAADLKGALRCRKTNHFPTISSDEIPKLLEAVACNDARLYARTRRALLLSLHTFQRPGEIRKAEWGEIDFKTATWNIPAGRMKKGNAHVIPLSKQVVRILKEQQEETGHIATPFVFPSQIEPRKPMSDGTVNRAIKNLGFAGKLVAHGFRALARTTLQETLGFPPEVIEKQLAHKSAGPLGEAYDRTQFLPQRKKMMQAWSDFVDNQEGRTSSKKRGVEDV